MKKAIVLAALARIKDLGDEEVAKIAHDLAEYMYTPKESPAPVLTLPFSEGTTVIGLYVKIDSETFTLKVGPNLVKYRDRSLGRKASTLLMRLRPGDMVKVAWDEAKGAKVFRWID